MTMRELGTCRNEVCRQTDLLWEDGFCCEDCREDTTGCVVPFCGCGGACGCGWGSTPQGRQPNRDDAR
jgi:hypothetical protein